ncbi:MAG TPA: heavy metal translocating P-type ATPase [Oceanipulchritudo sp.]|nr:heavy metal translocating P-type ATPase [Oceanipulchritudo sp.]
MSPESQPPSNPAGPDAACPPCGSAPDPAGLAGFGFRIGLSLAFAGQGMIFGLGYNNALQAGEAPEAFSILYWVLHGGLILSALAVVLLLGRPLLHHSAEALVARRLSVEALFVLSGFGAFAGSLISTIRGSGSVYYEVVSIVLCVYAVGKQIGVVQKGKVGQAIASFRHAFDTARVATGSGERLIKPVSQLAFGDRVLVLPGDPIPVDGNILEGRGYIRETALTGEPAPVIREAGHPVMAGTWSLDGNFIIQPNLGTGRTIDEILILLESGPQKVSRLQEYADRLMQFFVPVVSLVAAGTFLGWLLLSAHPWWDALFNSMAVLLVACPCALGLAMPSGIWGGLYHLSQRGIVGRNGHLLDTLATARTIVFDKTGTLSRFDLEADTRHLLLPEPERPALLAAIASLGSESHHPVSAALAHLATPTEKVTRLHVFPGQGLGGTVGGKHLLVGEASLLLSHSVALPDLPAGTGKPIHVAREGSYAGTLFLQERLRPEAESTLLALAALGCQCRILSGDPAPATDAIAGIPVMGGLSPEQKAVQVRQWAAAGERVLFVGDGINDLPAMQASDAALAIDLGAALATEFADGLLLDGRIASLPSAIRHARRLQHGLRGNLRFALAYNSLGMALAAAGLLHPVLAAFLMVGSSAFVSFRALRIAGLH